MFLTLISESISAIFTGSVLVTNLSGLVSLFTPRVFKLRNFREKLWCFVQRHVDLDVKFTREMCFGLDYKKWLGTFYDLDFQPRI